MCSHARDATEHVKAFLGGTATLDMGKITSLDTDCTLSPFALTAVRQYDLVTLVSAVNVRWLTRFCQAMGEKSQTALHDFLRDPEAQRMAEAAGVLSKLKILPSQAEQEGVCTAGDGIEKLHVHLTELRNAKDDMSEAESARMQTTVSAFRVSPCVLASLVSPHTSADVSTYIADVVPELLCLKAKFQDAVRTIFAAKIGSLRPAMHVCSTLLSLVVMFV